MWMTILVASVEFIVYSQSTKLGWSIYYVYSTFETLLWCHTQSQIIHKF